VQIRPGFPDEEVLKNPVQQLAKKYGASDVGSAKAWRKLGVPLPGLGYWTEKKPQTEDPVSVNSS
jgi:hypothetical protein